MEATLGLDSPGNEAGAWGIQFGMWARSNPNEPPGPQNIDNVESFLIKQQIELLEAFTGCETENRYLVKDDRNMNIFFASEQSSLLIRCCCSAERPFSLCMYDAFKRIAYKADRPFRCRAPFWCCFLQYMEVRDHRNDLVGTVNERWSFCKPHFTIHNFAGQPLYEIIGPFCTASIFCNDVVFQVNQINGPQVATIAKKWGGFLKEVFTDADTFGLRFTQRVDVHMKATILAATFLIDFMYFEKTDN